MLPVEARYLHVDDREAERASGHFGVSDALLHRGQEIPRYHAADDGVDELVTRSALLRLDAQPGHRELAVTARLLLHLAFGLGRPRNRLPVRDLDVVGVDLDAELARQLLERDRHVRLAHAAQDGLVRLRVALDPQHRVFVLEPVERVGELVLVALRLRLDGHGEQRLGRRDGLDVEPGALGDEEITRSGVAQLRDRADVARRNLAHVVLFLAAHGEELMEALVALRARICQHVIVLHGAAHHLEQVHAPHIRVDDRLEHDGATRAVLDVRRGCLFDQELREAVDTDLLRRAPAQHGEDRRARDAGGECLRKLVDLDLLVAEVALHEVVVGDDDALDERVVNLMLLGLHVGRDGALRALR